MRGSRPLDEEALLIAARSGAEEFSAFYRHFERSMLGFFMRATGQADLAADLTAETFARALESVATYDPAKGRADQWLLGIAHHVLSGSYRRGRVDAAARERLGLPRLILDDHATETISRLTAGQDEATNALAELSQEQRRAVEARILQERDYAEIACAHHRAPGHPLRADAPQYVARPSWGSRARDGPLGWAAGGCARPGDLLVATRGGARTCAIAPGSSCRVRRIADGPALAGTILRRIYATTAAPAKESLPSGRH